MNAPWKLVGACGVALVFSVATLPAANDAAATTVPANPTFTKDVLPIFQKSCRGLSSARSHGAVLDA